MGRGMWLLAAIVVGLIQQPMRADPPFKFPEAKTTNAELRYIEGLPVLTVSGTAREIGEGVGQLALKPGKRVANYPEEILRHFHAGLAYLPILKAGEKMVEQFPADYQCELDAMARASGVAREKLVVANTLFDLKKLFACSALMVEPARSATGGSLMGRNLDYPGLGYLHEYSLVTVCRPKDAKHAFALIGFPGLIGCLSGINDAGLAVAVLEVPQTKVAEKQFDINGLTYGLCHRRLLEECSTIAEAHEALSKMKRTALSNLAVADRTGVAVFEISPQRVVIRKGVNGTTVCTNHFLSEELRSRVAMNFCRTFDRFAAMEKVSNMKKNLGVADLHLAMHVAQEPDTMQTMIFEPSTLRLHLAIGSIPASQDTLRVLDLEPLFREVNAQR